MQLFLCPSITSLTDLMSVKGQNRLAVSSSGQVKVCCSLFVCVSWCLIGPVNVPETEVTKNCIMPALFFICNQILSLFFYQVLYISIQNLPKSHWVALATFKNLLFNHCLLLGQENLLCNCLVKYYSLCLICGKFQMVMKVKKERKTLKLVLLNVVHVVSLLCNCFMWFLYLAVPYMSNTTYPCLHALGAFQ